MNKLTKITISAAMAAFIATPVFSAGNGSTPNGKPFIEIAGQIIEVQADINTLEAKHQTLVDKVDALALDLQGQIDAIYAEISTLQATDVALQESLNAVIDDLATQGTAIDDLLIALSSVNTDIVNLTNTVGDNSSAIADLETQQATILDDIAALDAGAVTAMTTINDNASLIKMLEKDIADLESNKQNDILGTCPAGTSVSTVEDDGSLLCGTTNSVGTVTTYQVYSPVADMDNSETTYRHCHEYAFRNYYCLGYDSHTENTFANKIAEANCPAGYQVSGGGFAITTNERLQVVSSVASDNNTWRVNITNYYEGNTNGLAARAYAQCIKVQ